MRLETFVIKTLEQVNHVKVVAYRVSVFFLRKGRGVCVWPCINHDYHKLPRQPQLHDGERPQLTAALWDIVVQQCVQLEAEYLDFDTKIR
jgi:hypothetical protein